MSLKFGDVNIMVITDDHSWVAGHRFHEPELDLDYGLSLSFYTRLKEKIELDGGDLFLVMNGDFMDGTGLSAHPPVHLVDIIQRVPFDAINIGNHELYRNDTIDFLTSPGGFVDSLDGRYLTSNVIHSTTKQPIGNRFRFLYGANSGYTIVTFGFLYNFDSNCKSTIVEQVQDAVESDWFLDVLSGNQGHFDAVLVLAHMHYIDPLVYTLHAAIRGVCGDNMPILFITGHTHIRAITSIDAFSFSFEAGRYLDTIGFVSFPVQKEIYQQVTPIFSYHFINGSSSSLKDVLGSTNIDTAAGLALTRHILELRDSMGLETIIGCSSTTYDLYKPPSQKDSLLALYLKQIVPSQLFHEEPKGKLYIQNSGAFRYSLFKGFVTVDDIISITPYNDTIFVLNEKVTGTDLLQALSTYVSPRTFSLSPYVITGSIDSDELYEIFTPEFDAPFIVSVIRNVTGSLNIKALSMNDTTTGTLIRNYIHAEWKCRDYTFQKNLVYPSIVFVLFTATAVLIHRKKNRRSQYSDLNRGQKGVVRNHAPDTVGEIL